ISATAGNHEAAQAAYERAVEIDPNHAEATASLASIAARKGEGEKARALAKRALELKPHQPTALLAEAIVDLAERKYEEAETRLKRILNEGYLYNEARSAVWATPMTDKSAMPKRLRPIRRRTGSCAANTATGLPTTAARMPPRT